MATKTDTIKVKVYAQNAEEHLKSELHRLSSGYVGTQISKILKKKFRSVRDYELNKKFKDHGFEVVDNEHRYEVIIELVDDSTVKIHPDFENDNMVFDFMVVGKEEELNDKLLALRETVLHFMNTG